MELKNVFQIENVKRTEDIYTDNCGIDINDIFLSSFIFGPFSSIEWEIRLIEIDKIQHLDASSDPD